MHHFLSRNSVTDLPALLASARDIKHDPFQATELGKNRTLVMLFFNASLRTRLSTQVAARRLGMDVITLNVSEAWGIEFEDGAVMRLDKAEHVREAAGVLSTYADVIGIRTFAGLQDRERDYAEVVVKQFAKYATVPIVNLESATVHPLQSLADLFTITERQTGPRPKVVLSWAPHPRALPQAVANSFVEWMKTADCELVITQPPGYELAEDFTAGCTITTDQEAAFAGADFVYAKNWSSYTDYGKTLVTPGDWMITADKLARTADAYFMHCLPVRRNVVVTDAVLDGPRSLVMQQVENRAIVAQAVLKAILENSSNR